MRESAFSSRYAPRRSIAAGVDGARLAVARCTWRVRAISVLARPAASMARISARLNSRIGQYRLPPVRPDGKAEIMEPAIPDPVASPTKKTPINQWEHRYLGEERFPETLSALEIEHFFTLDEDELVSVRERRGHLNRLALALQIGFLKMTGRTLNSVELIPPQILDHLGRQVDCVAPRIASIRAFYRRRRRTLFEHHTTALRLLGRSELIPHAERGLVAYLRREAAAVFDLAELMAVNRR